MNKKSGDNVKRLFLKQMAATAAAAAASPFAFGQSGYPERPIRLLVPYPPGGSMDPIARVAGQKINEILGQPVIVDNRPGGNTSIATAFVAKAAPDGYNILFSSVGTHLIHTMQASLPYDSLRDFAPICTVSRSGYMLAVHPSVPAKTIPEFIAYAKANPGKLNFGSAGIGNANHLAGELFNMSAGVKITHVPYKGTSLAMTDLLAGRIQVFFSTVSALQAHVDSGGLRAIAYTSQPPGKPPVPTFDQFGLKDFEKIELVTMLLAPRETPAAIVNKLADSVRRLLEMPDAKTAIENQNQTAYFMGPQQLAERLKSDRAKFAEIALKANIKLTDG
jgi:tripartite-type tricarboxylate transporter receptor subunit TctC